MEKGEEKALRDIEQHGCHIIHVIEEDEHPGFSYSTGIEKSSGQPELVVTGLNRELAHWIINEYNTRVRAGDVFESGRYYSGFLQGFDVTFKTVERRQYPEYFGWNIWLYKGEDFRVLQLIYPDTSGRWPWDQGVSEELVWSIPRLYAD